MNDNINRHRKIEVYSLSVLIVMLGIYLLCFGKFYPIYELTVRSVNNNRVYVYEISDKEEHKEELLKYMDKEDIDNRIYDKVTLTADNTNFAEWLITGKLHTHITKVEENTEMLSSSNTHVSNELANGRIYYNIDGTKFLGNDTTYIVTDIPMQIGVRYAKNQKEDYSITDYKVAYQMYVDKE